MPEPKPRMPRSPSARPAPALPDAPPRDYHDPASPVMALESHWAGGSSTDWHMHTRGQLLHAITGVMVVHSQAGTWVVPPNRALWLTAGMWHEVRMAGAVQMRSVYLDGARVRGLPAETGVIEVSPLLRELIVAAVQSSRPPRMPACAPANAVFPAPAHKPASPLRERLLMRLIVEELRVSDMLPLHLPLPAEPRVRHICEALLADMANADTAEQWAQHLGVTAKTVHRLFARETGMGFARWREQARLLVALRKIASGERIIDIAFDCGYASQSAFSAMFRRHFGVPPSAMFR